MKTTGLKLIIFSMLIIGAGGCTLDARLRAQFTSMHAQFTSMSVGCDTKNIQISNELVELNGTETWTATCDGKTYDCVYFPDADVNCYLRDE